MHIDGRYLAEGDALVALHRPFARRVAPANVSVGRERLEILHILAPLPSGERNAHCRHVAVFVEVRKEPIAQRGGEILCPQLDRASYPIGRVGIFDGIPKREHLAAGKEEIAAFDVQRVDAVALVYRFDERRHLLLLVVRRLVHTFHGNAAHQFGHTANGEPLEVECNARNGLRAVFRHDVGIKPFVGHGVKVRVVGTDQPERAAPGRNVEQLFTQSGDFFVFCHRRFEDFANIHSFCV